MKSVTTLAIKFPRKESESLRACLRSLATLELDKLERLALGFMRTSRSMLESILRNFTGIKELSLRNIVLVPVLGDTVHTVWPQSLNTLAEVLKQREGGFKIELYSLQVVSIGSPAEWPHIIHFSGSDPRDPDIFHGKYYTTREASEMLKHLQSHMEPMLNPEYSTDLLMGRSIAARDAIKMQTRRYASCSGRTIPGRSSVDPDYIYHSQRDDDQWKTDFDGE